MYLAGRQKLLVILGATATGKTQCAMQLAQDLAGEIIGADSRQIYRYMNIGTAKPSPEQLRKVAHHMIDVVDPDESLTLAEYVDRVKEKIGEIAERDMLPMLVGGTGQYITAVTEGWTIPRVKPNPELRKQLEEVVQAQGALALHQQLVKLDPVAAGRIHPNNSRRVIRALEVCLETGTPISELQKKGSDLYDTLLIGLQMNRQILYQRADERVDEMVAVGFVEEVRELLNRGYSRDLPSMSGVGYLEIAAHLIDGLPLETAIQRTKTSTHDFIRRQEVWFRGHDPAILWHNGENLNFDQIEALVRDWAYQR